MRSASIPNRATTVVVRRAGLRIVRDAVDSRMVPSTMITDVFFAGRILSRTDVIDLLQLLSAVTRLTQLAADGGRCDHEPPRLNPRVGRIRTIGPGRT